MKAIKKTLLVSLLVIAIAATTVVGSFAFSWDDVGNYYEKNAESYADQIENLVETIGQGYEDNAENYPDNAQENPETAPADYVKTAVKLGNSFLSGIKSLTRDYTSTFRFFK